MHTDVLIVGAGPSGLMMANMLLRAGVDCRIIDKKSGPTTTSKALVLHSRTLELLEKIDLVDRAVDMGQKLIEMNFLINGKMVGQFDTYGEGSVRTPYPFGIILEQSKNEQILLGSLQLYNKDVEWETEATEFKESADGVDVLLRYKDDQVEQVSATWVVGADGFRSSVRESLNLDFKGATVNTLFFLADVHMKWPEGRERLSVDLVADGFFATFPLKEEEHYRLLGVLEPKLARKLDVDNLTLKDVQQIMDEDSGLSLIIKDADWISSYHTHRRMASHFRVGQYFLIGDAAHVHSPAGGQGMNTGLQDAINLAWKLALVIN